MHFCVFVSIQSPEMLFDAGDGVEPFAIDSSFNFSVSGEGCSLSGNLNGLFDGKDQNELDPGEDLVVAHDAGCEKVTLRMNNIRFFEKNTDNGISPRLSYHFVAFPLENAKRLDCHMYNDSDVRIRAHSTSYTLGNIEPSFVDSWITKTVFGDDYTSYINENSIELPTKAGPLVLCPRTAEAPLKTQGNGFLVRFEEQ